MQLTKLVKFIKKELDGMHDHDEDEIVLIGGNVSNVVRVGDGVRRDIKPNSNQTHELLKHLESKNFKFAPKFLGIDEKNRERLSFIKGESGNYPLKKYMWSNQVLIEIAQMLRGYHDAVSDFPLMNEWLPMENTPGNKEVICHNDFAIYNIIFNHEKPVGIIDFDVAAPGPRLWDVAYTLYTCVPLSRLWHDEFGKVVTYDLSKDAELRKQRVQLFLESYDIKELKKDVFDMVILRLEALTKYINKAASEGNSAFQKMIDEGHVDHYQKDLQFIREHRMDWM